MSFFKLNMNDLVNLIKLESKTNDKDELIHKAPPKAPITSIPMPSSRSSAEVEHHAKCLVPPSLSLVLHLSRLLGVAPLNMTKQRDGWLVCVSPRLTVVSFIGVTFLFITTFTALIFDMTLNTTQSVYVKTKTKRVVWLWDITTVLLISFIAAYQAPSRLEKTFRCLNKIRKLNISTKSDHDKKSEDRKSSIAIIVFLIYALGLLVIDYGMFINEVLYFNRSRKAMYLYVSFYFSYAMVYFLEMQFIFCAVEVQKTITSLNDLMEELLIVVRVPGPLVSVVSTAFIKVVPTKSVNVVIDSISVGGVYSGYKTTSSSKAIQETIRCFAALYSAVCESVRELNDAFAIGLTFLVIWVMVHLIITPYNLITAISGDGAVNIGNFVKEMAWCSLQFFCAVVLVEPCHRTQLQISRTRCIISQLLIKTSDRSLYAELEKFSFFLFLNNVTYSPLEIFTLTRSLVASIVGSVATYLVIIMQFQASEY